MNMKARIVLIIALVLLAGAALVAVTWAAPRSAPLAPGGAPTVVAYQGEVQVGGTPYTGNGYFKFAVVNAAGTTTYWSNNGTSTGGSAPTAAVQLTVSEGLFSVLLGDTSLGGMTQPLTADVFNQSIRYLRVWFSSDNTTFDQLTPDTRIAAVPYALQAQEAVEADTVDGLHASELETHYQNVVVVAKSGGDYTTVQAAIDSITDATAGNAYLVWVAPGVYSETVTMKPYVHLQGAGQEATVITSTAGSGDFPPQATLLLANDTSLRDLTVGNSGADDYNAALLATEWMTRTLVADVTVRAQGNSMSNNYAIVLIGNGVGVTLQQVTALAENGSSDNYGLVNYSGAEATLRGGTFTGHGGSLACGIHNADSDTKLEAESVIARGENGSSNNYGLWNVGAAAATLRGGSFTARGGSNAYGICNDGSSTTLEAESVTALGENGSNDNSGLINSIGAATTLRGGSFTARGGVIAFGIANCFSTAALEAESVTALAKNGSDYNYGLYNYDSAEATLRGGSFTARGGTGAFGIYNSGSSATLETESVTALAENGSTYNYGLNMNGHAATTLRGGSFTGRGGSIACGICNSGSSTTLDAKSVTALGENASSTNFGLYNYSGAAAVLHGGSFTARGGLDAYGIGSDGSSTTLEAENITALGENGSSGNYGLYNYSGATANVTQSVLQGTTNSVYRASGTVTVSNGRLVGAAVSGTVTCVAVSRGTTFNASGCP
jgi:hypothetical protein